MAATHTDVVSGRRVAVYLRAFGPDADEVIAEQLAGALAVCDLAGYRIVSRHADCHPAPNRGMLSVLHLATARAIDGVVVHDASVLGDEETDWRLIRAALRRVGVWLETATTGRVNLGKPLLAVALCWTSGLVVAFDELGERMPEYEGWHQEVKARVLDDAHAFTRFQVASDAGIVDIPRSEW